MRKFVGVALLTLGVFGFGSYLASPRQAVEIRNAKSNVGSAIVSKRKSESFEEAKIAEKANTQALKSVGYEETDSNRGSLSPRNSKPTAKDSPVPSEPKKRLQKVTSEPVYFCGATTKKGTPCSRRVKGGGRCWQHKGRKALLSEKELRIKN